MRMENGEMKMHAGELNNSSAIEHLCPTNNIKVRLIIKFIMLFIFSLTCLYATIDTQLFVYPSLSRYLNLELGIAVMSIITLGIHISSKNIFLPSKYHLFIFLWIAYIILHCFISQPYELYRSIYLCASLIFIITLTIIQKEQLLSRSKIETVLLAVGGINIIYIIGQKIGVADSGSVYFDTTGCNENPTVTALYLVGCLPILIGRTRKTKLKTFYFSFLFLTIASILLLRCRTAYIGMLIVFTLILYTKFKTAFPKSKPKPLFLKGACLIAVSIAFIAGLKMYTMKKDSADSRLLIWKLSAKMIAEKPIGYGYGLFEKHYNLKQAHFFALGNYTETEKSNADFVYMPYNDFLEHGVEGGVIGMFFLIVFYTITIRKSLLSKDWESTTVFCSFAIMSLFNFVYSSIAPWLLLMCYASFIARSENVISSRKNTQRLTGMFLFLFIIILFYKIFQITTAQYQLKEINKSIETKNNVDDKNFAEIEVQIGTSEAFWTTRAINDINKNNYKEAMKSIYCARAYSSSPSLFNMEYYCKKRTGEMDTAAKTLDTLSYMLPHKLSVKHQLMHHYINHNKIQQALHYANDILSTKIKIQSEEAINIINQAKYIKESYE